MSNKRKPWFHFPDPLIEHTVFCSSFFSCACAWVLFLCNCMRGCAFVYCWCVSVFFCLCFCLCVGPHTHPHTSDRGLHISCCVLHDICICFALVRSRGAFAVGVQEFQGCRGRLSKLVGFALLLLTSAVHHRSHPNCNAYRKPAPASACDPTPC